MSEPSEHPADADPANGDPAVTESAETESAETEPAETDSADSEPAGSEPEAADSAEPATSAEPPAEFVAGNRRAAQVGTVLAVVAVLAAVLVPFLSFAGFTLWSLLTIAAAVLMVVICAFQFSLWNRVARDDAGVWRLQTTSWAGHLLSYLVALLGLVAALVAMSFDGTLAVAFWVGLLAGLSLLLAQSSSAVQFLRRGGPPGTIPAHLRRLVDATSRLGS